jgi:hypothetical protein
MNRYVLFLLLGIIVLLIGLGMLNTQIRSLKNRDAAEATVVEFREETTDSSGQKEYSPVFKYTDYDKEEITYYSTRIAAGSWRIGDKVTVVYEKDYISGTRLLTYRDLFGEIIVFVILGTILLLISTGYFVAQYFFKTLPLSNTIG